LRLAALIIKHRKDARGEVGKLDFDPFIDAQVRRPDPVLRPDMSLIHHQPNSQPPARSEATGGM
jgi:hypothetical protein